MAFKQVVLKEVNCPRCNAIAQERLQDQADRVLVYLCCEKCRLKKHLRLTTRKALKLEKRRQSLRNLGSQENNPRAQALIKKRILELDKAIRRAEIGI